MGQRQLEGIAVNETKIYRTFKEFYPFYLSEHSNRVSRGLHFVGTSIALGLLIMAFVASMWWLVALALIQGYAFAWIGHFFFEHNKPATFRYPWLSLLGDWRMWWEILTGRIRLL
ncbi:MAG: Mpo1-like protein [Methylomicrobium sp.]